LPVYSFVFQYLTAVKYKAHAVTMTNF